MLYAECTELFYLIALYIFNLYFDYYILVCYFLYLLFKVNIINSVIFLFELELKHFKLSKILPMWKIGVYIVLILKIILSVIFIYKNDIDIYFQSLMA